MKSIRIGLVMLMLAISLLMVSMPVAAQIGGEEIRLEAQDGLELVGLYFAPELAEDAESAPAVLLMHHSGSVKESFIDFIPLLHDAGYAVLTVDLRGHGETGGRVDWDIAMDDTDRWLTWLSEQENVDPQAMSIVGASIGGDLGLNVMAIDERVQTIVVLSPSVEVQGITTDDAVEAIGDRPIFLVGGDGDAAAVEALTTLLPLMSGNGQVRLYNTSACCSFFFMLEDDLADSIIAWLDVYGN
jgi:pimeloyl-ACP methyl ester carboxylesterase